MPPIDAKKLKMDILSPEPEKEVKRTPNAAAKQKNRTRVKGPGLQYDPHLREEKRREEVGQPPAVRSAQSNGHAQRKVDVIARFPETMVPDLNAGKKKLVDGLHVARHIGEGIVTGTVIVKKIPAVRRALGDRGSLKSATDLYLDLYHSVEAVHCDPPSLERGAPGFPGLDGSGVLIGIVDVGCDFRHKNFRYPSGATRIRYLWDQTVTPDESKNTGPSLTKELRSLGFEYGREFTADQINQALNAGENAAYEKLGYTPTAGAHGTHVMDIAAGNGREPALFGGKEGPSPAVSSHPGVAPNAQIVFVQLLTLEGGELGNSRHLLEAVDYIFQKADELKLPAVVNLSLSTTGGPHDGSTLVEQGFKALVEAKAGRAIVTSAGNAYQKRAHFSWKLSEGEDGVTILWYTDPRHVDPETTRNEVEIWYPRGRKIDPGVKQKQAQDAPSEQAQDASKEQAQDVSSRPAQGGEQESKQEQPPSQAPGQEQQPYPEQWEDFELEVTLCTPLGKELKPVSLGYTADLNDYSSDAPKPRRVGRISHRRQDPNNGDNQIDIRVPHVDERPWQIKLKAKKGTGIEFHAWIEQDDQGLSSFGGEADPLYTLGSISCSDATLTVGAFDTANGACLGRPFEATSAGPTRRVPLAEIKKAKGKLDKPDLSAPGVRIVAASAQGGVTVMSGTSMAAAHVTGLVALVFQLALRSGIGRLTFSQIRDLLLKTNKEKKPLALDLEEDPFHPDLQVQFGGGKINGTKCMEQVLDQNPDSVAIELQPIPASAAQQPSTPSSGAPQQPNTTPAGAPGTTAPPVDPSDPAKLNDLLNLIKGNFLIHSNNGFGEMASLTQFMKDRIQNKKGFRISVGPLS
ncbi:MAG TPA: S8 family serine peptidase [Thermoanaerobaculia bacterium]